MRYKNWITAEEKQQRKDRILKTSYQKHGLFDRLVIGLSMAKARYRTALGFCPMCNSDAPALDDCPLCDSYHPARGNAFPPPKKLRLEWLAEYRGVLVTQRNIQRLVRESRKSG